MPLYRTPFISILFTRTIVNSLFCSGQARFTRCTGTGAVTASGIGGQMVRIKSGKNDTSKNLIETYYL
jgi:hypothetical protein